MGHDSRSKLGFQYASWVDSLLSQRDTASMALAEGAAYGSVLLASTPIRKNRRLTYSTRSSSRIGNVHALRPGPNAGGEVVAKRWMVRLNQIGRASCRERV